MNIYKYLLDDTLDDATYSCPDDKLWFLQMETGNLSLALSLADVHDKIYLKLKLNVLKINMVNQRE